MVSVQAAAGSIINQAMRGFLEDMTVDLSDPNGLLEEYWAASMFWEYTEMEWDNGPRGQHENRHIRVLKTGCRRARVLAEGVVF